MKPAEELLQENCDNTSQCPIDYKAAMGSENKGQKTLSCDVFGLS